MKPFVLKTIRGPSYQAMGCSAIHGLNPAIDPHRKLLKESHPLALRDYILPVPALRLAMARCLQIVEKRGPGAAFIGRSRCGKTTAIYYLLDCLAEQFPKRGYIVIDARSRRISDPANAFSDVLVARNIAFACRGSADARFLRATNEMWMVAREHAEVHLILIIDEAQRYQAEDFDGFIAMTNHLFNQRGVRVTTFLWGQLSLMNKRMLLVHQGRADILNRFMPKPFMFDCVSSSGELYEILKAYDDDTEFPDKSGWSYPRLYFPRAVEHGLRLADYADTLWAAFAAAAPLAKPNVEIEFITASVEYLLTSFSDEDHPKWRPTTDHMSEAVASTCYAASEDVAQLQDHMMSGKAA